MARKYSQGEFRPINRSKYQGDSTKIFYRSSWEKIVFKWLDENPLCVAWGSETVVIPYISPVDNKPHRYFCDLKITFKTNSGLQTFLVEIKPMNQCVEPKGTRNTKSLMEAKIVYAVNQAKWAAAKEYAERRGMKFVVITENEIGLSK